MGFQSKVKKNSTAKKKINGYAILKVKTLYF